MTVTSASSVATMAAAANTPATITCSGLILTMSCSPAARLRMPRKLHNTAPNTCAKPAGRGAGSGSGGWALGLSGVIARQRVAALQPYHGWHPLPAAHPPGRDARIREHSALTLLP